MGVTDRVGGEPEGASGSELGAVRRVVLKLSGESLAGNGGYGIDSASLESTANQVLEAVEAGAELADLEGLGQQLSQNNAGSTLDEVDVDLLEKRLGRDAVADLEGLRDLEGEAGRQG